MDVASADWVQALIDLMYNSMEIGAYIYPVIMGFGLVRMIITSI